MEKFFLFAMLIFNINSLVFYNKVKSDICSCVLNAFLSIFSLFLFSNLSESSCENEKLKNKVKKLKVKLDKEKQQLFIILNDLKITEYNDFRENLLESVKKGKITPSDAKEVFDMYIKILSNTFYNKLN